MDKETFLELSNSHKDHKSIETPDDFVDYFKSGFMKYSLRNTENTNLFTLVYTTDGYLSFGYFEKKEICEKLTTYLDEIGMLTNGAKIFDIEKHR